MVEKKDPELTCSPSTPKSQLSAEQHWMKKPRTYQKRSSTTKDKNHKETQGGEADTQYTQILHQGMGDPQTGGNNYITEVLKEE